MYSMLLLILNQYLFILRAGVMFLNFASEPECDAALRFVDGFSAGGFVFFV